MVQIIGLIIAVYTLTRLLQVPFEVSVHDKSNVTTGIACTSALAFIVIGILTLMLLISGADVPKG